MPSVSRFHGISIYIYTEPGAPHRLPHFHAYYGEYQASFSISPPSILEGNFPRRQLRLVLAWAELYEDDIMRNWNNLQNGEAPEQIPGL